MTKQLFFQAITKFLLGVVLIGLLLFLPAGTFDYPNEWLFMGILFVPMFVAGFVIFLAYPVIIAKRIRNEEQVLEEGLQGYTEYKKKVKYRLLPFVW